MGFVFHTRKFSSMNFVQLCTRELKFLLFLNLVQLKQHISCTMWLIMPTIILWHWEGWNTVYGMGTICSVTPAVSSSLTITQVEDVSTKLDKLIRLTGKEQWRNDIVVKALDFQYRDPVLKTTGWVQGHVSLSSFQSQWNEYQEFLGTY